MALTQWRLRTRVTRDTRDLVSISVMISDIVTLVTVDSEHSGRVPGVWWLYDGMAHDSFYVLPHDSHDQVASVSDSKMLDSPRYLQHRLSIIREVSEESSASSTPHTSPKRNFSNYYLGSKSSTSRSTSPITRNRSPSPGLPGSPDEQYLSEKFRWHNNIIHNTNTQSQASFNKIMFN